MGNPKGKYAADQAAQKKAKGSKDNSAFFFNYVQSKITAYDKGEILSIDLDATK